MANQFIYRSDTSAPLNMGYQNIIQRSNYSSCQSPHDPRVQELNRFQRFFI
jgi:hypothetical protein